LNRKDKSEYNLNDDKALKTNLTFVKMVERVRAMKPKQKNDVIGNIKINDAANVDIVEFFNKDMEEYVKDTNT